ncbi:hypothetical protein ULMS_01220 [Patiriisocius marinistellae]|uniref:Uncharacterized protein n=1 Tax=Patiriisocius marinistellae TaxID=2494560 RepID=A0A5J4FUF0_9FLAO|nr:hypothetical protein [Patiriisocius marinistellae]GEQ84614.1 hypothetical protein ULMS_01220 [Patiriisocius marinistellae]
MEQIAKNLINEALAKAAAETLNKSLNGQAEHVEMQLMELYRCPISAKSLKRYSKGEGTPKPEVLKALSQYIGYDDFELYMKSHNGANKKQLNNDLEPKQKAPNKSAILLFVLVTILTVSLCWNFFGNTRLECMVWKDNHYEKTACSGARLEVSFNEKKLENFKKIQVCDETIFFKNNKPVIWYDKTNKELSYFSIHGIHPENGKTLKPITQTIIDKYVVECD